MKKVLLVLLCAFLVSAVYSKNIYDSADEETKALIEQADQLIEERKYETAFGLLSSDANEYIIAKRTEIATNYFAQSLMHQVFAFKDLEESETLYDVRSGQGFTYSLVMWNPADVIKEYMKKNGEKPILNYALGMYYYDVYERYNDQWIMTVDELVDNSYLYLQKAYDEDCYDDYSLSVLATFSYRKKDYENAIKVYSKKAEEYEFTGTDNYHYGIILWLTDRGEEGIEYVKKSAELYYDDPEYQSDAYIVTARIAIDLGDFQTAEEYLNICKEKYPDDYRILQYGISLYAAQGMKDKVMENSLQLFALAPENPTVSQMVMDQCNAHDQYEYPLEFFKTAIKKYKKNNAALANLYFHYSYQYYIMENDAEAKKNAITARKYFEKSNTMTEEIDGYLKTLAGEQ